jgi:tripartite-type tricarboxylate transporter receptor subunit TctC
VHATIAAVQTAQPQIASGQLRALAVMSAERSQAFAQVPTMKEQGMPELEVETWYGAFAPAGTPVAVVSRVNADINSLLKEAAIREMLAKQGMAAKGGPPERLGELLKRELARWKRVVDAAGIKAD